MTARLTEPVIVALVPAKDRQDSVAATVEALLGLRRLSRVVVIDDGSTDGTAAAARDAGAEVVSLPRNVGKGDAVQAGVAAAPEADVYLLVDADLAETAQVADRLLDPVVDGDADMTVGVLPPAEGRGGFGLVKQLARRGIRRACGAEVAAPLSGQRAVRSEYLRGLVDAPRFGLEVALTIDTVRAGGRLVEVPVPMDHRHTGRSLSGFAHRGRQGSDILRALWPRLTTAAQRIALSILIGAVLLATMVWSGNHAEQSSTPLASKPARVVIFGIPRLGLDDIQQGRTPNLKALMGRGAVAADAVRTSSHSAYTVEAYATLGAGVRVAASGIAADARMVDDPIERDTAGQVAERRTGLHPTGQVVVLGGPQAVKSTPPDLNSQAGALGQALRNNGLTTAVLGNGDQPDGHGGVAINRPTAVALMDNHDSVDRGNVRGGIGTSDNSISLLTADASAPFGVHANGPLIARQSHQLAERSDVLVVDPGDMDRADRYGSLFPNDRETLRRAALARTDAILGEVVQQLPPDTLLLVVGLTPPHDHWEVVPLVMVGPGIPHGNIHSPSTRRTGLVTLTDLAPTVLAALGARQPDGMVGAPLRYHAGGGGLGPLLAMNRVAQTREAMYLTTTVAFIVIQAVAYLLLILLAWRQRADTGVQRIARFLVLVFAAWAPATYLYRALPVDIQTGVSGQLLVALISVLLALAASRFRRSAMAPFQVLCGGTLALLMVDVATGSKLQVSSLLGYSPQSAARYTGVGNTAFAVLAATAIICGLLHVQNAAPHRRREALVAASVLFVLVVALDGWPTLGADVGGTVTLVPVLGICIYVLSGRVLRWQTVVMALLITVLLVAGLLGLDLLRPAAERTHFGKFAADALSNHSTFWSTVARKWKANMRIFQASFWTWTVPVISLFGVYLLVVAGGWQKILPRGSALRTAVVATLAAGVIGWLVNDSGIVVTALTFVYIGPFVTLLWAENQLEPAG